MALTFSSTITLRHHGYQGKLAVTVHQDREDELLRSADIDLILRPFVDAAEQAAEELAATLRG